MSLFLIEVAASSPRALPTLTEQELAPLVPHFQKVIDPFQFPLDSRVQPDFAIPPEPELEEEIQSLALNFPDSRRWCLRTREAAHQLTAQTQVKSLHCFIALLPVLPLQECLVLLQLPMVVSLQQKRHSHQLLRLAQLSDISRFCTG